MGMDPNKRIETRRQWISGLVITLTVIVSYLGFWHLAPGITFAIACVALAICIITMWIAGRDRAATNNQDKGTVDG